MRSKLPNKQHKCCSRAALFVSIRYSSLTNAFYDKWARQSARTNLPVSNCVALFFSMIAKLPVNAYERHWRHITALCTYSEPLYSRPVLYPFVSYFFSLFFSAPLHYTQTTESTYILSCATRFRTGKQTSNRFLFENSFPNEEIYVLTISNNFFQKSL